MWDRMLRDGEVVFSSEVCDVCSLKVGWTSVEKSTSKYDSGHGIMVNIKKNASYKSFYKVLEFHF